MKKTLITAVALAACATQLFAQNVKEDVVTLSLSLQQQKSVSTSKTVLNAGLWSQVPQYYKTMSSKITQANVIQAIAAVMHGNAGFYGSRSQLVLVQGELGGFFNVTEDLTNVVATPQANFDTFTATVAASTIELLSARLATGRHYLANPVTGAWPPGHHQPWGQFYVKVYDTRGTSILCDNVTPFFSILVQECYDCYYLNSFISDASFSFSGGGSTIPPCCGVQENLGGSGKDVYYMTLSFDNTVNNPYLNTNSPAWIGYAGGPRDGVVGLNPDAQASNIPADGLTPDFLNYIDPIASGAGARSPSLMRFTLNGIMTYNWTMKFINSTDLAKDFVGTGKYSCNGYGFIALICGYLSGSGSFAEKIVNGSKTCAYQALPWYDSWYGVGYDAVGNSNTRETPVNLNVDLSYHCFWDEEYEPGEQWGSNPPAPTGP